MGGSDSQPAETVDNKGMLNGNSINNGIILENFEIVKMELFISSAFLAVVVLIL